MAPEQRIQLILEVGESERVGWGFVVLDESGLQLFDLRFLSGGEVAPSEFVSCVPDFVQNIAQLVRSTLSGGRWIVELVRKPSRKFAKSHQAVTLLFAAGHFA